MNRHTTANTAGNSLTLEAGGYDVDYVGQIPAAKSYGTMRMYHLHGLRAARQE